MLRHFECFLYIREINIVSCFNFSISNNSYEINYNYFSFFKHEPSSSTVNWPQSSHSNKSLDFNNDSKYSWMDWKAVSLIFCNSSELASSSFEFYWSCNAEKTKYPLKNPCPRLKSELRICEDVLQLLVCTFFPM